MARAGGAGRGVDPGQDRRRVTLEWRTELAEGQHLGVGDYAHRLEDRVDERRSVSLGEDQVVVVGLVRVLPVVVEMIADEAREQVGRGHRGGRVAGAGGGAGT